MANSVDPDQTAPIVLVYCLMYFPLFVGDLCLSLFSYALLCVHSSFAIILKRKRKLVALLLFSYRCIVSINDLWLFLRGAVGWSAVCDCGVPDHTHLLFALLESYAQKIELSGFDIAPHKVPYSQTDRHLYDT